MDENLIVKRKTRKPLLFISMASMVMLFAAFTSAYIVSKNGAGLTWDVIVLPTPFLISTILIVLSSITMYLASKAIKVGDSSKMKTYLGATLALGLGFAIYQFIGFDELNEMNKYFAGTKSTPASSYIFAIIGMHFAHMVAGLISLMVTFFKARSGKYSAENHLGLELTAVFWHFLDVLWIYLYIFLSFSNDL